MRRPQAVGLRAVMLSLLVLSLLPVAAHAGRSIGHGPLRTPLRQRTADASALARTAPEAVKAGTTNQSCTGWRSTLFPPRTIRVLQTRGPNAGKVIRDPLDPTGMTPLEVPFRDYVGTVIAAEWPSRYPLEVLKAGAIAVKQFAWYYTIVYRGGVDADGICYDVRDDTVDQWYDPATKVPAAPQLQAIAATWFIHLRKTQTSTGRGRFILTGYRSGANVPCGADADAWRLYQRSAYNCGVAGMNVEQILRTYLDPRLEIVTPGRHDIVGSAPGTLASEVGDVSAAVEGPDGSLVPHVWQPGRSDLSTGESTGIDIGGPGLLGQASEDVTGDGWDDLVVARATDPTSLRLSVAPSDGTGYSAETTWWSGDVGLDPDHARLFTGDVDGDLRSDAALLFRRPDGTAELLALIHRKGTGFKPPVTWWSGPLDPAATQALAGDMNGDGRMDLLLLTDLGSAGRQVATALSSAPTTGLGALRVRFTAPDLVGDGVKAVVADVTNDGRDDLLLVVDGGSRTRIEVLKSLPGSRKPFVRSVAWRSTTKGRLSLARLKLATSDIDDDGLMDLVLFRDRGTGGTGVLTFHSPATDPDGVTEPYGILWPGPGVTDPAIGWSAIHPY